MKKTFLYSLSFYLIIIFLLPFITTVNFNTKTVSSFTDNEITVKILDEKENKVNEVTLNEYIKGVIFSYASFNFEDETFKTLAVIARTYALKSKIGYGNEVNENHPEYDVCTNEDCCLKYTSCLNYANQISNNTNINIVKFVVFNNKIKKAISKTDGEIIMYKEDFITPYFFIASPGTTESYLNYFGKPVSYLLKSNSPYEDNNPYFNIHTHIKKEDFVKTLKDAYPDLIIDKTTLKKNIKILSYTSASQVDEIQIGNKILDGKVLYEKFKIPSIWIKDIKFKGEDIIFITDGKGRGIGLSLYGADGFSKNSLDYKIILRKYYQGVIITNIFKENSS